jgi:glycine/D-amino acid oxidase-like deaminating enzyme
MQTSVIIVGQGLCGTWLSYWLQQAGIDHLVIDEDRANTSTRVASGVINPVTGRRMSTTWMADELLPFAESSYAALGELLHNKGVTVAHALIQKVDIIDFFSSPDRRLDFEKKAGLGNEWLHWPEDENDYQSTFHYGLGYGIIRPAWQVDLQAMLEGWRALLIGEQRLVSGRFVSTLLRTTSNGIEYGDWKADKIVFCDGMAAANAGYFKQLPFALNKGEALIVKADELPGNRIYKKGSTITPWRQGLHWVGSTYNNDFTHEDPTPGFRQSAEAWLRATLKIPFEVLDHLAAIRPATIERRPFAGWHPRHPQVGILNGTGTKGVTLAPYFARQLAQNLVDGTPVMDEVDMQRYRRMLLA